MKIIEITKISEDKKKIFFTPKEGGILTVNVYDEFSLIYQNTFEVSSGYSYWVSWLYGWYDSKVLFEINGNSEEVFLSGTKKDFSDTYFGGLIKKVFLPDRTPLCEIMDKNGSDKASRPTGSSLPGHNYSRFYYDLFLEKSGEKIEIFELGLGTNNPDLPSSMGSSGHPCASLRSWEDFFPEGNIFGADIDVNILVDSSRSKTFYCDQTVPKIVSQMWGHKNLLQDFDIIIEDGLHEFIPNVIFLENSIHKIKRGGYFIIEDISIDEIFNWTEYFKNNKNKYLEYEYNFLSLDCEYNKCDNNLIVIRKK
jgi:hypothetical protein